MARAHSKPATELNANNKSDSSSLEKKTDKKKGKGAARAVEPKAPPKEKHADKPCKISQHSLAREDVLALGGDEEDLELLKEIDSDDDCGAKNEASADPSLSKDLANFLKGLNFAAVKPIEVDDSLEEEAPGSEGNVQTNAEGTEEEEVGEAPSAKEQGSSQALQSKQTETVTIPKVGPNSKLLVEPNPQWYAVLPAAGPSKPSGSAVSSRVFEAKQKEVAQIHSAELAAYERETSGNKLTASSSDAAFLQRVLTSGTLSDRLSALTLMAQSSPLHNTRALETLRGMGQKKGREESLKALRAICDWWVGGGAPDRKLKYLADQPLSDSSVTSKHLLIWYFEDWLKKYFFTILQTLETLSLDPLPYIRIQAMTLIFGLLKDKPEQEQNLLRLLVNKLGDSERSVASRASHYLLQLLQAHPSMKGVVLREVTALVLRPSRVNTTTSSSGATHLKFTDDSQSKPKAQDNLDKRDLQQEHSKYYAVITLNQIMLAPTEVDKAVAAQLINLYFELFKEILGSSIGAAEDGSVVDTVDHSRYGKEKQKKALQKNGKGKGKAEQQDSGFAEVEDANSKLTSAILTGVNRALPFAKLSLNDVEFSKHIDTLFMISHKSTFNISLQALRLLMFICETLATSPSPSTSTNSLSSSISDRYYRALYSSLLDPRLNTSSKHAMYLNLLLKSLKMDTRLERVKAFVRRFVQLLVGAGSGGIEFVAGGLYLLGELFKTQPSLRDLLSQPKKQSDDVLYDPKKRDPQYANAGASAIWELAPLLDHFHPTVRLHATQLLEGKDLTANADLSLNTLSHFLDRFIYKNPKKIKPKGSSAMQPGAAPHDGTSVHLTKGAQSDAAMVNDDAFVKRNVKDVPVDQIFFHKFFSQKKEKEKMKAAKASKRKGEGVGSDDDGSDGDAEEDENEEQSIADEKENSDDSEGEAEIWKAIQATNPDLNPGDESSDYSDSDSDSDSDEAAAIDAEDDEELANDQGDGDEAENGDDDSQLSLAEDSDNDDLINIDDVELPGGLLDYDSDGEGTEEDVASGAVDDEWGGFGGSEKLNGKRKRERETGREKKKRMRALPTFATYEDYAKLIEDGPEDDI